MFWLSLLFGISSVAHEQGCMMEGVGDDLWKNVWSALLKGLLQAEVVPFPWTERRVPTGGCPYGSWK